MHDVKKKRLEKMSTFVAECVPSSVWQKKENYLFNMYYSLMAFDRGVWFVCVNVNAKTGNMKQCEKTLIMNHG